MKELLFITMSIPLPEVSDHSQNLMSHMTLNLNSEVKNIPLPSLQSFGPLMLQIANGPVKLVAV